MAADTMLTALTVIEPIYVLLLCGWILLEKRSPAATLAWIFGLIALPGAGFVIYFFLGPRRIRRRRLKRLRAQNAIARLVVQPEALSNPDPGVLRDAEQLVRLGEAVNKAALSTATGCELLLDGAQTFDSILEAISAAKDHVHVLYYIFEPDETGRALRDALVERARAGLTVRLLVDAVGSATARRRDFFAPLVEAGAEVAAFNRLGPAALWGRVLNFRNHRKIVVVDGRIGFTGGVNVTDEENPKVRADAWRDTHLRLEGPCVAQLQLIFLEDWCYACGTTPERPELFPRHDVAPGELVQILDSGPDKEHETIKSVYFAAICAAMSRVWLTTAYFVPDEPMSFALRAAALRGVDVRVLVPKNGDSRTVAAAARSYYDALLGAGVRIFEYEPRMLHAKTLVVDEWLAAIGTANFDNRSFRLNFEVSALVYGRKLSSALAEAFERDLTHAKQVTGASRVRLRLGPRIFEGMARVLSPML
ncbi:MAG: cardiolipin synthase [Myxococcales bacterium]|nr:cardiolipin synthase [Myxococcales bacterium]